MKNYLILPLFACILLLSTFSVSHAEVGRYDGTYVLPFDLLPGVDRSTLIVEGILDASGEVTVDKVLKGTSPVRKLQVAPNDQSDFEALAQTMGASLPLHVILFLDRPAFIVRGTPGLSGLVALGADGVYTLTSVTSSEPIPGRVPHFKSGFSKLDLFTPSTFLDALNQAVAAGRERDRLLSLPASAADTQQLLDFLDRQDDNYFWSSTTRLLQPGQLRESIVLEALRRERNRPNGPRLQTQLNLLHLLQSTPPSRRAFPEVLALTRRPLPPPPTGTWLPEADLHRESLNTLVAIDDYRASVEIASRLSLQSSDLFMLLSALSPEARFSQGKPYRPHPVIIDALLRLSHDLRQLSPGERKALMQRNEFRILDTVLLTRFKDLGHPRLVADLYAWTKIDDPSSRQIAVKALSSLASISVSNSTAALEDWWQKAAPLLAADYDLKNQSGRRAWFKAYLQAEPATQKVLLQLWLFENKTHEKEVLQIALSHDENAPAAKAVLSTLWLAHRLAPFTRLALAVRFISFKLGLVNDSDTSKPVEIEVVAHRDFTFPTYPLVRYKVGIAFGDGELKPEDASTLTGFGDQTIFRRRLDRLRGPVIARASVEMYEVDQPYGPQPPKVEWSHRWLLDPFPFTAQP